MLTASTPPLRTYTRTLSRLGWSLLLFYAMFIASNLIVETVFLVIPSVPAVRAAYGLFSTVAYAAPFFFAGFFYRFLSQREVGKHGISLAPLRSTRDRILLPAIAPLLILAGLAVNLIASEINYYLCLIIGYVPALTESVYYDTPAAAILYMTTAFAPAFAEEFLFRGVVYGQLRPFGKWQAVLISAMTFSLMHQNVAQMLYTFVCGIILALMYEWTGSIWCSVFFHLFNNELAVLSESLIYGAYGENAYYILMAWNAILILLGLISAVILIVYAVKRKKARDAAVQASPGLFGTPVEHVSVPEAEVWDAPISRRQVRKALCAPGMMTFIIYSLATIFSDYISVLLYQSLE